MPWSRPTRRFGLSQNVMTVAPSSAKRTNSSRATLSTRPRARSADSVPSARAEFTHAPTRTPSSPSSESTQGFAVEDAGVPLYGMHDQPARAQSFGDWADAYDRYRAGYPPALAADLLDGGRRTVLDIGCGTGKAAVALAERGGEVLGVEPDDRMARIARAHGIPVEVARFEDWDAAGRRFDVITCASTWQWLD